MKFIRVFLFFLINTSPLWCIGQSANEFKLFFEKVYLHTDKAYYAAGEDIWFKAYLINAQTGLRINTSYVLYVELISPVAKIVSRETIYLQNGLGEGDFILPANAASGNYRIRAYTNWMQNFSDLFFFEKEIQVASEPTAKNKQSERYNPTFIKAPVPARTPGSNQIGFYPEGGNLVVGIQSLVAFKANDYYGKGIAIVGKIVGVNGDSITAFTTSHSGIGSFVFTPKFGEKYKAVGKYASNEMFEVEIPAALPVGYSMHVFEEKEQILVRLEANSKTAKDKKPRVIIRCKGKKVFTDSTVSMIDRRTVISILKSNLPQGINIVTLYDEDLRPVCERLFYVENSPPIKLIVSTHKQLYKAKDSVAVRIEVANAQGVPIQARMSLAVTNADIIPSAKSNIVSYLNLESEVKGDIENPTAYFDVNNLNRLPQLNLLLLTQGWRQFLWRRLLDTSVVIKHMPEAGITLSGKVQKLMGKKGLPNMNVSLYAQKSKGDKLYQTTTNAAGNYYLDGLLLFGQQDVRLSTRNSQTLKREGEISLDSLQGKILPIREVSEYIFDTSATTNNFWKLAARYKNIMSTEENKEKGTLENVTVTGQQSVVRLAEDVGMRFGADSLFTIKTSDGQYRTVENYILQRYPGAYTNADQDGFFFYGDGGARLRPRWVIDGREDRFSTGNMMDVNAETGMNEGAFDRVDFFNIPINKVKSIAVTPIINQFGKQIMVIKLSLLPGALDGPDFTIVNATINGYYEARKYYEPSFITKPGDFAKSDLRTTLFWASTLQTDAAGKAVVGFTNNASKIVEVCVEGITDAGVPFAGIYKYNSK